MAGEWIWTAVCTVAPIIAFIAYFYARDVRREPRRVLVRTFLWGLASLFPTAIVGSIALLAPLSSPWFAVAYMAFAAAAIPEELFKLLVVRGYSARQPSFDEPMDGIVYGVTAALGFAALENALYVVGGGWLVAAVRAVTAVPMHAATGAILGYAVARARFTTGRRRTIVGGVAAAIAVHGVYDFALIAMVLVAAQSAERGTAPSAGVYLFPLVALGVLLGAVAWLIRTSRRLRREQLASVSKAELPPSD